MNKHTFPEPTAVDFSNKTNVWKRLHGRADVFVIIKFKTGYFQDHMSTLAYNELSDILNDPNNNNSWLARAVETAKLAGDTGEIYGVYLTNTLQSANQAIKNECFDGVPPFKYYDKKRANQFISTLRKGK